MGILDQAKTEMQPRPGALFGLFNKHEQLTPEQVDRRYKQGAVLSALGMGLSQLGAGQPVNMSPAFEGLQKRQQQAQLRKVMEQPGLMDGFSPQQRAILATMPESMAVELIMQRAFAPPPDPTLGVEINGQLVNPITGESMGDYRTPETAPDKVSIVTGEQAAALGLKPDQTYEITMAPDGSLKSVSGIGAGSTTINMAQGDPQWGQAPNDHVWLRGADGQVITQPDSSGRGVVPIAAPIPGSKAAADAAKAEAEAKAAADGGGKRAASAATSGNVVIQDISRLKTLVENSPWYNPATGLGAETLSSVGGTNAANAKQLAMTIRANIGFDRLQRMREESPTGGALGQVAVQELEALQSTLGSLSQSQGEEQLIDNLNRLNDLYTGILRKIYETGDPSALGLAPGMIADPSDDDPLGILK